MRMPQKRQPAESAISWGGSLLHRTAQYGAYNSLGLKLARCTRTSPQLRLAPTLGASKAIRQHAVTSDERQP